MIPILFYQCQKEISNPGQNSNPVIVGPEPISARLQGNILDENNQPAQGVTVKVGSQTATTDFRGYFSMNNAALDKKSALVTAEKTGYFKAFRTFAATSATNQVTIKLVKKMLVGTVDAATGGSVTLTNGAKITLPANGVVKASNNSVFSGSVNVYAAYIDPSLPDIVQNVPGSFMANDKNGARVILESYGMMAVELESAGNEKLQIKSGATASLTTPIPSSLLSSAPATIPMWFVDEQTGIWKEEGSATKQGDVYVGEVKHFTYWNCDIPMPTINLTATFQNIGGLPLAYVNVRVRLQNSNSYLSAHGLADSLGVINGAVPANVPLVLELIGFPGCGGAFYSQNIGPFSQNTNLGVIAVTSNNPAFSIVYITGQLKNCSGNPVTNGSALIYYDNYLRNAPTNSNGVYTISFPTCTSLPTVDILGVDNSSQQQSSLTTVTLTPPTTNAPIINACGTSALQYCNYTLDGTPYSLSLNPSDSLPHFFTGQVTPGNWSSFFYFSQVSVNFDHNATVPGTYAITQFRVGPYTSSNVLLQPFNIVVTSFPQVTGQFCEGTFAGQFKDSVNVTHSITNGAFRVRR